MIMTDVTQKAEEFITNFYSQKTNKDLRFHSIKHVKRTVKNVQLLSEESGLSAEEKEILQLAAWFHDTGHAQTYEQHERKSAEIARDFLREENYPEEKIEKVMQQKGVELILSASISSIKSDSGGKRVMLPDQELEVDIVFLLIVLQTFPSHQSI